MSVAVRPLDHPLVRQSTTCPLCQGHKDTGLVACWPCYHDCGLRYGDEYAGRILDRAEKRLEA